MNNRRKIMLLGTFVLCVTPSIIGQHQVPRVVIGDGGGVVGSTHYLVAATIGEAVTGDAVSLNHSVLSGFWASHSMAPTAGTALNFRAIPGPAKILLRWEADTVSGLSAYLIERAVSAAGPWAVLAHVPAVGSGSYEHLDGLLTVGQTYFYRLSASYASGPDVVRAIAYGTPYAVVVPANVVRVGPAGTFSTIQAAINAATGSPWIVSIEPGTYPAFTINAGTPGNIRIVGDRTGMVTINTMSASVRIENRALGETTELSGLTIGSVAGSNPAILIQNCQGPVIIDELSAQGGLGQAGVEVANARAVAIQRTSMIGPPGLRCAGASIVAASSGQVDAMDIGGGSSVTVCDLSPGVTMISGGSSVAALSGVMPILEMPELAATGVPFAGRIHGFADGPWILAAALGNQWFDFSPTVEMVCLLDLASIGLVHPTSLLDSNGQDTFSGLIPAGLGVEGYPFALQAVAIDPIVGRARFSNLITIVGMP